MVSSANIQRRSSLASAPNLCAREQIAATLPAAASNRDQGPVRQAPRVGCAGIVRYGTQILLGLRDKEPGRGLWVLPGGGVGFGETFEETLHREISEEVGIEIDVDGVFNVCELINPPHEHRVIVYMNARYRSGKILASSDLSDVRFFGSDELKEMSASKLISPFVESVLRKAALL